MCDGRGFPSTRARYVHDPAVVRGIYEALRAADITFVTYLPDSFNYPLVRLFEEDPAVTCVGCSREDEGVAMAMGAFLGGRWPAIMMEGWASGYPA